eukprot:2687182-Pyramimonas_sp.AAC.2
MLGLPGSVLGYPYAELARWSLTRSQKGTFAGKALSCRMFLPRDSLSRKHALVRPLRSQGAPAPSQGTLVFSQGTLAFSQGTLAFNQGTLAFSQGTLAFSACVHIREQARSPVPGAPGDPRSSVYNYACTPCNTPVAHFNNPSFTTRTGNEKGNENPWAP